MLRLPSPDDISTSALHGNAQGLLTQISSLPTRQSLASTGRRGALSQHDCLLLNALFSQSQNRYPVLLAFILWNQMLHYPPTPSLSHLFQSLGAKGTFLYTITQIWESLWQNFCLGNEMKHRGKGTKDSFWFGFVFGGGCILSWFLSCLHTQLKNFTLSSLHLCLGKWSQCH